MAKVVESLDKSNYEMSSDTLNEMFGSKISRKSDGETVITDDNGDSAAISSKLRFDSLKSKSDSYGVGVRAGSITPQIEDEVLFREEFGLPAMSASVKTAWDDSDGIRRPTTLKSPSEVEEGNEPTGDENVD